MLIFNKSLQTYQESHLHVQLLNAQQQNDSQTSAT